MFGFRRHGGVQVGVSSDKREQASRPRTRPHRLTAVVSVYTISWQAEKGAQELRNGCLTRNRTLPLTTPGHRKT